MDADAAVSEDDAAAEDDWDVKMKKAEAQQAKVDEIVQDALAKCVKPSHVPITKMVTGSAKAAKNSRAMLLEQVQKEKDAAEKNEKANLPDKSGAGVLGLQAAINTHARMGTIVKAQKLEKDSSEAQDVIKMGKHMLK